VNIHVDGKFTLAAAGILAARLRVGQEITPDQLAKLKAEDDQELATQKALHFLSIRPRSRAEVRNNLVKRGMDHALVETTLSHLEEIGMLDDEAFARLWVENRNTFRPRSKAFLRLELRRKGLEDVTIQAVLEEGIDEQALALQAAKKQARRYAHLDWQSFRLKMVGFLGRRGFSYEIIAPVVSEVWHELQTADPGSKSEKEAEK
jgi:regulatory protein